MKDYSNNEYEKKLFILSYTKTEENIIVNLANGENYSIPNVAHNEKVILEKMRAQVINSYDKEIELRKDFLNTVKTGDTLEVKEDGTVTIC